MKKQQKAGLIKRFFTRVLVWPESPFTIISSTWKAMFSTKVSPEELTAFKKLTPGQRWEKVKKPGWTDKQLLEDRAKNCLVAYILIGCSVMILFGTFLTINYLNFMQLAGAMAYAGAALVFAARKSMWCYALDARRIILFNEWLRMPEIWVPAPNAKGGF